MRCAHRARARDPPRVKNLVRTPIFYVLGGFRTKNATSSSQDPRHHSFCNEPSQFTHPGGPTPSFKQGGFSSKTRIPKIIICIAALRRKEQVRFSLENRFCLAQIQKIFRCAGLRRGAPPPCTPQSGTPSRTYPPVGPEGPSPTGA